MVNQLNSNKRYNYYNFLLATSVKLVIRTIYTKDTLWWIEPVRVSLFYKQKEHVLGKKLTFISVIDNFQYALMKALDGTAVWENNSTQNIGFLWNNTCNNTSHGLHEELPIDLKNYMVFADDGITTWLYQEKNDYFLELTPSYKWHFSNKKYGKTTYQEFLAQYQPILKIEVKKEYLQKALVQVNELEALLKAKLKSN